MKPIKHALILAALSFSVLGACSSHTMAMKYEPTTPVQKSTLPVKLAMGHVQDNRSVSSNWLGSIDGGVSSVSQRVYSDVDTADAVASVFTSGLQTRGLLADQQGADYRIDIGLAKFSSTLTVRKSTYASFIVAISDIQTGKEIFTRQYSTYYEAGNAAADRPASATDLGKFANLALNESVDRILDDPRLLVALQARHTLALANLAH